MKKRLSRVKESEFRRILILRTIGNFLVLTTLFVLVKTFYLPVKEEVRFFFDSFSNTTYVVEEAGDSRAQPQAGGLSRLFQSNKIKVLTPEDPNFSIVVPKIGANAKILPEVDASREDVYLPALQNGVAHTLGTSFPGQKGHVFLFAHSTDYFWNVGAYNAVFYLLYKLEKGDHINLYYKGERYVYTVVGKEVVKPSEVQYITRKTNSEFLTLQTCWPPGTTLERLLVFAVRTQE